MRTPTMITLTAPRSVIQGELVTMSGELTAENGVIVGAAVDLDCDTGTSMSVPVARTGAFTGFIEIPMKQAPGRILCTASFTGGGGLAGSARSVSVTVERYVTPTPDPTPSDDTPSPTPSRTTAEPSESATPTVPTATAVAVGGTSTTEVPRLLLIIGGAATAVVTVGGMAVTAARGRRVDPDEWDSLIGPDADAITPRRRLGP